MAQAARLRKEEEARRQQSDEERELRARKRLEERTRQEQEGILRRQQEAEAAARAARDELTSRSSSSAARRTDQDYSRRSQEPESISRAGNSAIPVPVVTPQPSRPASSSQSHAFTDPYRQGPPMLPLESPTKFDDDTDAEKDDRNEARSRPRNHDDTPSKSRYLNAR